MTGLPNPQLDALFVRYWDNTLSPAEAEELTRLLTTDSATREHFQLLCMQAVTAAELPAIAPPLLDPLATPRSQERPTDVRRGWSRRRILALGGGGLVAGIGGILLGQRLWGQSEGRVQLTAAHGTVRMHGPDGHPVPAYGFVPRGGTVSTEGIGSVVTLIYPDGSTVSLIGDSTVTVEGDGRALHLHRGTASADLRSRTDEDDRITFTTALVTLQKLSGTRLTLGQEARAELEVQHGTVAVSAPTGEPLAVVREGEQLTVTSNGDRHQRRTPPTKDEFVWDFRTADGWAVGRHAIVRDVPLVRSVRWPDPYYDRTEMFQIRSEQPWVRGYFQLYPESRIHVRYRAQKACPRGQMCFCVRTPQLRRPDTGMLDYNGGFEATAAGEWKWLHIQAADMLDNKHGPRFGSPWIAFLIIFNTFEENIGLEIAEFRVTPPGKDFA